MKTITFNGQCPACELQNNLVTMRYNVAKELECPTCNLRIYPDGKKLALIHRTRGKNDFDIKKAPTFTSNLFYIGADAKNDSYTDGSMLLDNQTLEQYLDHEVNTKSFRNLLDVLLESYADAFYHDKNVEYYQLISDLVGIDISHAVFTNNQKSNKYLFQYLHFVIECYELDTYEELKNFCMTSQIIDLYECYIAPYTSLLENDLFLQKLALKKLCLAIIKAIYRPMQVLNN